MTPLLQVEGLAIGRDHDDHAAIVHGVSFEVGESETVALLGGTGSGKTLTARSIMGVLPPGVERQGGSIVFEGTELTALDDEQWRRLRGRRIAYVPQNAKAALHPLHRIDAQMRTVLRDLELVEGRQVEPFLVDALRSVRIRDAERVLRAYPHELSGGMAQRIAIAIARLARPKLLIADEPTTGLDATVQAQVMRLLEQRIETVGASTLVVTHDLGVVAQYCDRAVIVEHGVVAEQGTVTELFESPSSDYGRALVAAAGREAAHVSGALR
jgi:ABC-type glutathione transport system ATPase component